MPRTLAAGTGHSPRQVKIGPHRRRHARAADPQYDPPPCDTTRTWQQQWFALVFQPLVAIPAAIQLALGCCQLGLGPGLLGAEALGLDPGLGIAPDPRRDGHRRDHLLAIVTVESVALDKTGIDALTEKNLLEGALHR